MKPIIQDIPLQPNSSFVAGTYRVPQLETEWHQHLAYELILIMEGTGLACIETYEGNYEPCDIYFLGSNVPHKFQPNDNTQNSVFFIHFTMDCLGSHFFDLPECLPIKQLLDLSGCGLRITGDTRVQLQSLIQSMETAPNSNRIILLLQCLQLITSTKEYITLNTLNFQEQNHPDQDFLHEIIKYTNDAFRDPVTLSKVAAIVCMSVPTFCHYFKRYTHKTYITYLNEIRVRHACYQLRQTNKSVIDIGYESGYNSESHFYRQFQRLKKTTPLQYRKEKTWK